MPSYGFESTTFTIPRLSAALYLLPGAVIISIRTICEGGVARSISMVASSPIMGSRPLMKIREEPLPKIEMLRSVTSSRGTSRSSSKLLSVFERRSFGRYVNCPAVRCITGLAFTTSSLSWLVGLSSRRVSPTSPVAATKGRNPSACTLRAIAVAFANATRPSASEVTASTRAESGRV